MSVVINSSGSNGRRCRHKSIINLPGAGRHHRDDLIRRADREQILPSHFEHGQLVLQRQVTYGGAGQSVAGWMGIEREVGQISASFARVNELKERPKRSLEALASGPDPSQTDRAERRIKLLESLAIFVAIREEIVVLRIARAAINRLNAGIKRAILWIQWISGGGTRARRGGNKWTRRARRLSRGRANGRRRWHRPRRASGSAGGSGNRRSSRL